MGFEPAIIDRIFLDIFMTLFEGPSITNSPALHKLSRELLTFFMTFFYSLIFNYFVKLRIKKQFIFKKQTSKG